MKPSPGVVDYIDHRIASGGDLSVVMASDGGVEARASGDVLVGVNCGGVWEKAIDVSMGPIDEIFHSFVQFRRLHVEVARAPLHLFNY